MHVSLILNVFRRCLTTLYVGKLFCTIMIWLDCQTSCNIGNFYRYANAHLKSKSNVGPLKSNDGSLTFDPLCKANMLSAYFSSVYTVDNHFFSTSSSKCYSSHIRFNVYT